jgi:hypothetical protein
MIANDKEEPVTGQDGLRVMQIIKLPFKVVLRKSNQFIDKVKLLGALHSTIKLISVMYRELLDNKHCRKFCIN